MGAELEYLFRHALVCEGSYQLLPPQERAALHRVALDLVPVDPADPDASAAEMARHAGLAQQLGHDDAALLDRECDCLLRAARRAGLAWDQRNALAFFSRLLDREPGESTRRVAALSGLAGTYMNMGNRSAVRPLVGPGIEAACRAGATLHEAKLRRMMGELLLEASDLEAAKHHAGLARQAAQACGDAGEAIQAGLLLSRILAAGKEDDSALNMMEQLYEQADSPLSRSQVANSLGVYFARRDVLRDARRWLETAAEQAAGAGHRHEHAVALGNLGNVLDYMGDKDAAAAAYRRALQVHQSNGAHSWAALQVWNLGLLHNNRRAFDEALPLLQRAAEMFRELGQRVYLRQCCTGMAVALFHLGRVTEALPLAERAAPDDPGFVADEFTPEALNLRAQWALLRGDWDAASQHARRLRELANAFGDAGTAALLELRLRLAGRVPDAHALVSEIGALRHNYFMQEGRVSPFAPLVMHMDEAELQSALWFRGHLVQELTPGVRAFLVQWLKLHEPNEVKRLQADEAPVWAALAGGLQA